MLNIHEMYQQKLVSPAEAVQVIKSGDTIWAPPASNEPNILFDALADRKDKLEGVRLRQFLPRRSHAYMDPSCSKNIFIECLFATDKVRHLIRDGYATYVPVNFGDIPRMIRQSKSVDVFMITVSPMDEYGYFTFGLGCDYSPAAIEVAKKIIVEVNPNMPRTHGYNNIHISQVDKIVEYDIPIIELMPPKITAMDEKIASYIVERIEDGSTIQVGIGGVPAAVCKFLEVKKDLGIHTELISDYIMELAGSGAVNGSQKSMHKGKAVCTIVEGTRKLFDYLDNNPSIELRPVDYTNNVTNIAQQHKMVSINGTIEVDLFGQCCSESIGPVIYGGSGGQSDFARGVTMCPDGKGFIVLYSTTKNDTISKIVPVLSTGTSVTTARNYVDHIVTEYGIVQLRGKTIRERAQAIISIAHPNFREQLRHAAQEMHLI